MTTTIQQIYAAATPAEREQITQLLIERVQAQVRLGRFIYTLERMHGWITTGRRDSAYHFVGDRRRSWWQIKPTVAGNTPHVIAASLLSMTVVIITALASASIHIASLLLIPLYGIALLFVLIGRKYLFAFTF